MSAFSWRRERRFRLSGLLLLASLLGLAFCGRLQSGRGMYAVCWGVAFLTLVWAVRRFPSCSRTRATVVLLGAGLLLRVVFLWAWPADSDLNRYVVEGALQAAGENPYLHPPGDARSGKFLPARAQAALAGVNHKELAAAYPPLAELYCRAVAAVAPTTFAFKVAAAVADMGTCLILAKLLVRWAAPVSLLLLCVANPLNLVMAAGEGHVDAAMACLIALALLCFSSRREGLGFVLLGAAAMVKYPAMVLVPFFMTGRNTRKVPLAFLPMLFFACYAGAGRHLFTALISFAGYISHGGPVVALLQPFWGQSAPVFSLGLGGLVLAGLWLVLQDRRRGPPAALTVALACLPTLYPWYLLPLIPLWLARPGWSYGWLLAAQGCVTAPTWLRASGLGGEALAMLAAWLPFAGLAVFGCFRALLVVAPRRFTPVTTLGVVIPVRNEVERLGACLAALSGAVAAGEVSGVVVADGGSTDATVAVARAHGARVVTAGGGRGGQIAAAMAACPGDAVFILHADALCGETVPRRIRQALAADSRLAGGAVGMAFFRRGLGLACIAGLNALRAQVTGISFGDQGQFFRRDALELSGGFSDMALMEDVELALRLREAGETVFLGGGLRLADRRWATGGFVAKVVGVFALFFSYLAQRRLGCRDATGRRYYQRYYGRPPHHTEM